MINNYTILENGVIRQDNVEIITYNKDYIINSYDTYGELGLRMANLRAGFLLGSVGPINSILDVGYGNGDFLKVANNLIPSCYGNDISGYEIPDGSTFIDNITERHFDVICFFDVLEHFLDISFVKDLKCDYIFLSVPWCHNFSDEWFLNWKHRKPNEHLHHFNSESLESYMKDMGYSLVKISNFEDSIRKSIDLYPNILSGIFKKTKQI